MSGHRWAPPRQRGRQFLLRHGDTLVLVVTTLSVGLVPLVLWTGITGASMNLGGDNGLLYFGYPLQWLSHTSVTALSQNVAGYNPIPYYIPLCILLFLLHETSLNAEGVFLGAILGSFFLGTIQVSRVIMRLAFPEGPPGSYRASSLLAGVVVVSAPILAQTQWSAVLPGLWWEALLPWLLFFYLNHQATGRLRFAVGGAIVSSLFASAITDAPETIGAGLAALLLVAALHLSGVSGVRVGRALTFTATVVGTSAFWSVAFLASFILPQLQVQSALSTGGKEAATALIRALTPVQSPLAAMEMRLGTRFLVDFRWPQLVPDRWSSVLGPIGALPYLLSILGAAIGVRAARRSRPFALLALLLVATCVPLILVAPDLPFGERIMLSFTRVVPGWTATRNFYNVFGLPLVFLLALTVPLALATFSASRLRGLASRPAIACLAGALLLYNGPFFAGNYFRLPYQLSGTYNRVVPGLPSDYIQLLAQLRHHPPGPVLSLPFSAPAWTVIPDGRRGTHLEGVYIGISPVYFLTGRSDYNGVASLTNPLLPSLPSEVQSSLSAGNAIAFATLVRTLGVRYVILNTAPLGREGYYGVGAVGSPLLEATETSAIVRALAPRLLSSRGPFQLRAVADAVQYPVRVLRTQQLATSTGFVSQTALGLPTTRLSPCPAWVANVRSLSPWSITVRLTPRSSRIGPACTLVLEYPQSVLWTARVESRSHSALRASSSAVLGLFQGFSLPSEPVKPITVVITYQGEVLMVAGFAGALLAWLVLTLAAVAQWRTRRALNGIVPVGALEEKE